MKVLTILVTSAFIACLALVLAAKGTAQIEDYQAHRIAQITLLENID